ncbi:hypothetical protein DV515_00011269 [Chloebia gouldiae]|uniref:Methyltransferase type 11 domain-containing protein n=1 Tax=Chloebia gouldiae TaxID=44316 RepID=A0A3L8S6Y6_CHLGU|nr:hypothetical protein DV515_00011330 [Chloebia gouldiae]RLV97941.1 hypothetical protein DV515_00011269 [Chloebia gouldiae]
MGAGGRGAGQLAPSVPSGAGMGLPAAVRERVAAVHRGSALPERLRLYDGWAARYEQHYDAVTVVGALGEGQVPSTVLPELLRVTKPGGFLCLTTRSNPSNLRYKAELEAALGQLEQSRAWQKLLAQEVEYWERATTEEESTQGTGYISGVVYIYQKCPVPHLEEG